MSATRRFPHLTLESLRRQYREGASIESVLREVEEYARTSPSPLLQSQLEYARALLTPDEAAEPHYRAALAHDLVRWPWIRARVELAYGSWRSTTEAVRR